MKTIFISLLVVISTAAATTEAAPIFAKLDVSAVSRNMTLVNPMFNLVTGGSITFNSKSLELTLNKRMPPCPAGMFCAQVMPAPLNIRLTVKKVEQTECAVVYTASTPANVKATVYEEVVVEDYTYSKCEMVLESIGTVTYKATGISSLSKLQETAAAHLKVDGQFIRALN